MATALRPSAIVPPGLRAERVSFDGKTTIIEATAITVFGQCPDCGSPSARVHSRYQRHLADLPLSGRVVRISLDSASVPLHDADVSPIDFHRTLR